MSNKLFCGDINVVVFAIVILFGISSWIDINGVWVQLPLLVPHLPESWTLPSYFTIIIQIANIGPLLFTIATYCSPGKLFERPVSFTIIVIGAIACLLLAFLWKETTIVGGEEHSTALLTLVFFLALVDCTSSVSFLTFMSVYKLKYMTAYFIGEGLSGLLPSLVALGQGVGQMSCVEDTIVNKTTNESEVIVYPVYHEARFPIENFFFFLFTMLVVSGIAFLVLNFAPFCKKERHSKDVNADLKENGLQNQKSFNDMKHTEIIEVKDISIKDAESSHIYFVNDDNDSRQKLPFGVYIYFLVLTAWINGVTNSALLSVQTYSTLPYNSQAYHLSATLANIANPLGCFVTAFLATSSPLVLSILTLVGSGFGAYIMAVAVLSPNPPFIHEDAGPALVITAWVLTYFILTYTKVSIATRLRTEGRKALLWCGAVTQIGSLVASIIMYVLVNVSKVFKDRAPCT